MDRRPAARYPVARMSSPIEKDIAAVAAISAVPTVLRLVSEYTGMRFVAIARVTHERWVACAVRDDIQFGLEVGGELDLETTICNEVRNRHEAVVFDDATTDVVYCGHPTPKMYGFRSYVSVPIERRDGSFFGTLCAIDPLPAKVSDPRTLATLQLFAELVSLQLDGEDERARAEMQLAEERSTGELREQFIAVLGHDVRNPLSSIALATHLLLGSARLDPSMRSIVERIRRSSDRITGLVGDLLDLARGRLGGGLPVRVETVTDLAPRLGHVVDEIASAHPGRVVQLDIGDCAGVRCDIARIEQALSNLLGNALLHGDADAAVDVAVRSEGDDLVMRVRNSGAPIAPEQIPDLFHPFHRRGPPRHGAGLGLGLFIVSEIAKAHAGDVTVTSTVEDGTVFTMRFPRASSASAPAAGSEMGTTRHA